MRNLIVAVVLLLPLTLAAQQRYATQPPPQPLPRPKSTQPAGGLSQEQQSKQDALVKANPELKQAIEAIEQKGGKVKSWGNTDAAGMSAAGAKPAAGSSTSGGNKNAAASAYKRKDYAAAIQHYKALAAEGDTEAAVMLGIMHEQGQGVDKDPSAAYAWYGRAADQGDPLAQEIVRDKNDKDELDADEYRAAQEKFGEISQELDEPGAQGQSPDRFRNLQEQTGVYVREADH